MQFRIQTCIAFVRSAGVEALDHRRVKCHLGLTQDLIDVVPVLKNGHRIQPREQELIVFECAFNLPALASESPAVAKRSARLIFTQC